eukprot:932026-Rhodomonas_salina.1
MSTHPRLGSTSGLHRMEPDLVQRVLDVASSRSAAHGIAVMCAKVTSLLLRQRCYLQSGHHAKAHSNQAGTCHAPTAVLLASCFRPVLTQIMPLQVLGGDSVIGIETHVVSSPFRCARDAPPSSNVALTQCAASRT